MDEMWQAEMWVEAQDRFYEDGPEDWGWSSEVDEWEDDNRSDFEHASDWLASAGWGTDEDYGSYTPDPWE